MSGRGAAIFFAIVLIKCLINIGRVTTSDHPLPQAPTRRPGRPAGGDAAVRESLLEHGRDLLLQHGFGNVSTRQIAAAAGTTPAMIHYYFGDKRGLYRAMIESAVQPLIDSVRRLEPTLALALTLAMGRRASRPSCVRTCGWLPPTPGFLR